MAKLIHEVRCGVHGFIRFNNLERKLIDSQPFQRLRDVHQLAMTYHVYPGATHTRFEHSLGVMEFAGRIFDSVFSEEKITGDLKDRLGDHLAKQSLAYWRTVVRIAGLLHDIGHLPFSHAAEDLLPDGWNHERVTAEMIRHSEIMDVLESVRPKVEPEDVVDLCWDAKKRAKVEKERSLPEWQAILSELITGNTFGADRIDYLLRDGLHAGVPYGRFGPDRLIQGLRLVVDPSDDTIKVGLDFGAIHAAESLLLARYFMYTQVYLHDVRRVYDVHLKDYLKAWLPGGRYPSDWKELLKMTDTEVISAMRLDFADKSADRHATVARVMGRQHYRTVFEAKGDDFVKGEERLLELRNRLVDSIGADSVRIDWMQPKQEVNRFPVIDDDGQVQDSTLVSHVIAQIPPVGFGFVFTAPEKVEDAKKIAKKYRGEYADLEVINE